MDILKYFPGLGLKLPFLCLSAQGAPRAQPLAWVSGAAGKAVMTGHFIPSLIFLSSADLVIADKNALGESHLDQSCVGTHRSVGIT